MDWYQHFFITGPDPANAMHGEYSINLVILSYVIATITSYVALDISSHLRKHNSTLFRIFWWIGGAFVMGTGIWSMHFIGMLAFYMDMPMSYNIWWTALSMLVATIAAALAFLFFMIKKPRPFQYILSGLTLGAAISTMHYTGMAGMNNMIIYYRPGTFLLSNLVAFIAATAALWLAVHSEHGTYVRRIPLKIGSALIMGVAIAGMHYTGMAAAVFTPAVTMTHTSEVDQPLLATLIATIELSILGIALISSSIMVRRKNEAVRIQLDAIVQSSVDAIIGKDLNSIVTSWNVAAEKMFGYTENEMLGQSILRLIPAERQNEEALTIDKIKNGGTLEYFETERIRKDGKIINVSVTVSPIRNGANKIIGVSKIVRDITVQKQLEQQLRQSQKMEAIGQLTGGIAHDFNNLLGIIVGNLDLIEEQVAENREVLENVQTAQKAATRGADLTKRLLAFSRLQKLNPTATSLENSISNIMEMAVRTLGPEIKIITKLDHSVPPVLVDPAGLESALLNLAVNARDAMPNGGSITISTQSVDLEADFLLERDKEVKPGRYAHIMVSDTGHGIPAEILTKVFEPFFTTKPRGKGTGLGLSMVYGFIKQSGGLTRIYSEVNHGTTISMYLPLSAAHALPTKIMAIDKNKLTEKANGTVLVVDDEIDLLKVAVAFLEKIGYRTLRATDGPSALVILEREKYIDLLLTDIIMPGGMSGVELAAKARQFKPNIKVVYSSGFPSEALAEKSGTKIDGQLINKPYNRNIFVETIRGVMEQPINNG